MKDNKDIEVPEFDKESFLKSIETAGEIVLGDGAFEDMQEEIVEAVSKNRNLRVFRTNSKYKGFEKIKKGRLDFIFKPK